jgi:hypothetical protein
MDPVNGSAYAAGKVWTLRPPGSLAGGLNGMERGSALDGLCHSVGRATLAPARKERELPCGKAQVRADCGLESGPVVRTTSGVAAAPWEASALGGPGTGSDAGTDRCRGVARVGPVTLPP